MYTRMQNMYEERVFTRDDLLKLVRLASMSLNPRSHSIDELLPPTVFDYSRKEDVFGVAVDSHCPVYLFTDSNGFWKARANGVWLDQSEVPEFKPSAYDNIVKVDEPFYRASATIESAVA